MTAQHLAILGSSHSDGTTSDALRTVVAGHDVEVIDLNTQTISVFDYEQKNLDDDFLPIARKMSHAETILFATPVYWYAMSAQMKIFFDRLSDLLFTEKELGRALAGGAGALLCVGSDPELPDGYEVPFARTCAYFDMDYLGGLYVPNKQLHDTDTQQAMKDFGEKIFKR